MIIKTLLIVYTLNPFYGSGVGVDIIEWSEIHQDRKALLEESYKSCERAAEKISNGHEGIKAICVPDPNVS